MLKLSKCLNLDATTVTDMNFHFLQNPAFLQITMTSLVILLVTGFYALPDIQLKSFMNVKKTKKGKVNKNYVHKYPLSNIYNADIDRLVFSSLPSLTKEPMIFSGE